MRVSIDRSGRVVVPKPMRDELGLVPGTPLEIDVVDGHLELSAPHEPPPVLDGTDGPVVAATGGQITDSEVQRAVEAARERR